MPFLKLQHSNQFGFKNTHSANLPIVNETMNYYKRGRSNFHVVSLDAANFLTSCEEMVSFTSYTNLYYTGASIWRLVYQYYGENSAVVSA